MRLVGWQPALAADDNRGGVERVAELSGELSEAEIQAALERVLAAPGFRASPRNRQFLRYIVERTLAGDAERIKAFAIAVDVFGRGSDFDPNGDPIVRNEAARLRSALTSYYALDGRDEQVVITVPVGGYVPRFERRNRMGTPAEPAPRPRSALGMPIIIVLATPAAGGPGQRLDISEGMTRSVVATLTGYRRVGVARLVAADQLERLAGELRTRSGAGTLYLLEIASDMEDSILRCRWILTEYDSGTVVASQQVVRSAADVPLMSVEKEVGEAVAFAVGDRWGAIRQFEEAIYRAAPLEGYVCVMRAMAYPAIQSLDLHREIKTCLAKAVADDPHYSDAWAMLAYVRLNDVRNGYGQPGEEEATLARALADADEAVRLAPLSALAHQMRSTILFQMGDHVEFERAARRALELNPGNPERQMYVAHRLFLMGRYEEGADMARRVLDAHPYSPPMDYVTTLWDHYRRGDYEGAARIADLLLPGDHFYLLHVTFAAIFGQLGWREKAREQVMQVLKRRPDYRTGFVRDFRGRQFRPELFEHFAEGLRRSGLDVETGEDGADDPRE